MIMGRIKTTLLKRTGEELLSNNLNKFTNDFEDNKKILPGVVELHSKKFRNVIAGYIARLVKKKQETK